MTTHLASVQVTLFIAINPEQGDAHSQCADGVGEMLRHQLQSQAAGSSLLDYTVAPTARHLTLELGGQPYAEDDHFNAEPFEA